MTRLFRSTATANRFHGSPAEYQVQVLCTNSTLVKGEATAAVRKDNSNGGGKFVLFLNGVMQSGEVVN